MTVASGFIRSRFIDLKPGGLLVSATLLSDPIIYINPK
jgi:hypothetical protein